MLFSVMSGRMRISRAARVIVSIAAGPEDSVGGLVSARLATSARPSIPRGPEASVRGLLSARVAPSAHPPIPQGPADSVGGLLSARVASFRQRLLERLEPGALAHHPAGAQELIDRDVRRHLDGQPRHVARRARDVPAELAHDEQRRLTLEPERPELRDEGLGLAVGDVERLDHRERAVGDPRRDRDAQRLAAHRPRQVLCVAARLRPEGLPAAFPLGGADRALTRATGPLLSPGLLAAPRHLAAASGGVGARTPVRQLPRDRLMEQRHTDLDAEDVALELHRPRLLALHIEHRYGRHDYFFSAAFCCAFVSFTLLRIITREPFAPGTAPRTRTRFCSGITRTTLRFSTVRRSPPMRPGR